MTCDNIEFVVNTDNLNLLPHRFFETDCSCSGALSIVDVACDAGDSCVIDGVEVVNSDAAVLAYVSPR